MRRTALAPTTIAITIALAAMLGGCASTPTSSNDDRETTTTEEVEEATESSTTAACADLSVAGTEVAASISDATDLLATDPTAAAVEITDATLVFEEAVGEIDNEEVRDAAQPVIDGLSHFAEAITAFAANPAPESMDALTASSEEVDGAFTAIGEICE